MAAPDLRNGDALVELLGLPVTDQQVQDSLELLARGMRPELDPDDEHEVVDFVQAHEMGLEFGFEDGASQRAADLVRAAG